MASNSSQPQKAVPSRKRARQSDGTFKGDNPATPELNEAWEPVEAEPALEKEVKYTIKPKVTGTTQGDTTAGKYKQKPGVRPAFGKVYTQEY